MEQLLKYILSLFLAVQIQTVPSETPTRIFLTGDLMLGRSVMEQSKIKRDFTYPFRLVCDKLKTGDIVFANLETPILESCPKIENEFIFCADKNMLEGLRECEINVVNLANNHTKNMGISGLKETEKILAENGIKWVGDNNLEIMEKNGVRYGFLGFDLVDNKLTEADLNLVRNSKTKVDILIVGVHWGVEYQAAPTTTQKEYAQKIISAGADSIAGTHPHWVQDVVEIEGKPVFYSLGNFIFDQMWAEETKRGLVGVLNYDGSKLIDIQKLPIYMYHFAQPNWEN